MVCIDRLLSSNITNVTVSYIGKCRSLKEDVKNCNVRRYHLNEFGICVIFVTFFETINNTHRY